MARTEATADERDAFKQTLEPLLVADGRKFDVIEWTVFFEALRDIPPALLAAAVLRMVREVRKYPFRPGDVRAAAEASRLEVAAALPFVPCVACRDRRPGWVIVVDPNEVPREDRCDCWRRHQQLLSASGWSSRPVVAALPEASSELL